jgi:hypothetical protein
MKILKYPDVQCECKCHNLEPKAPEKEIPICGNCGAELKIEIDKSEIFLEE